MWSVSTRLHRFRQINHVRRAHMGPRVAPQTVRIRLHFEGKRGDRGVKSMPFPGGAHLDKKDPEGARIWHRRSIPLARYPARTACLDIDIRRVIRGSESDVKPSSREAQTLQGRQSCATVGHGEPRGSRTQSRRAAAPGRISRDSRPPGHRITSSPIGPVLSRLGVKPPVGEA